MGPIISPWPKLCGSEMGNPYGAHIYAHMRPIWVLVGHVGWAVEIEFNCYILTLKSDWWHQFRESIDHTVCHPGCIEVHLPKKWQDGVQPPKY